MPETTFHKFIPFAKVDATKREVWGIVTAEVKDKGGETCDYASTKPFYQAWSAEFVKATDGKSVGNLRYMHQMRVVGKGVGLEFRDTDKEIWMGYKVTEDAAWSDVEEGVLTGFSQGGRYVKGPDAKGLYTADPSEVSLVDNPALGVCHFAFIRADGTTEMRKVRSEPLAKPFSKAPVFDDLRAAINEHFDKAAAATPVTSDEIRAIVRTAISDFVKGEAKTKSVDGVDLPSKCFAFVGDKDDTSTWKLPIEFPGDDEKTKSHIQNALARFGQTEGIPEDEKAGVLKRIKAAAKKHGIDSEDDDSKKAAAGIRLVKGALALVEKGMYDVAAFAQLIDSLSWIQRNAEMEREIEGDESDVPSELLALIAELCQNFLAMADEETKELIARPASAGGYGYFATTAKLRKASSLLTKAAAKIQQTAGEPAKKENTTMSDLNKKASLSEHLKKAQAMADDHHEKLTAQIDKCAKCVGGDDDEEKKAEKAAAAAAAGTPVVVAGVGTDAIASFEKNATTAVNKVIETMTDTFTKFMEKLANTLEPPKAVQADPAAGRVVTKTADTGVVPAAEGAAAGAGAAVAEAPKFVPVNGAAAVDPKVREAFKSLRGAPLSE